MVLEAELQDKILGIYMTPTFLLIEMMRKWLGGVPRFVTASSLSYNKFSLELGFEFKATFSEVPNNTLACSVFPEGSF